jgi:hypothetical protein
MHADCSAQSMPADKGLLQGVPDKHTVDIQQQTCVASSCDTVNSKGCQQSPSQEPISAGPGSCTPYYHLTTGMCMRPNKLGVLLSKRTKRTADAAAVGDVMIRLIAVSDFCWHASAVTLMCQRGSGWRDLHRGPPRPTPHSRDPASSICHLSPCCNPLLAHAALLSTDASS